MQPEANISLPNLDNSTEYICVPNVAVLDEDDDNFSESFLTEVVERTNDRAEHGDLILLTIGHTEDELPETEQPEPVGYVRAVKLGKLHDRKAILADLYIKADRFDEVMTYPRRSAELWHDSEFESGFIDIVSVLRRTPARNLGLLTHRLQKAGDRTIYIKPFNGDMMPDTKDPIEALVTELQAVLSRFAKTKNEKDDDNEDEDEEVKDDHAKDCTEEDRADMEKDDEDEEQKDDYDAEPSGSNTFVPGLVEEKKAKKMRKDSDRIKLARLERRNSELEAERDSLLLKLRRSEREQDLIQLEAEGYQFDRVEELEHAETLDSAAYEKHLNRVRSRYRRVPVGAPLIRTAEPKIGTTRDEIDKVLKFAQKENITDFGLALDTYKKLEVK
jgi:hypothetical protein